MIKNRDSLMQAKERIFYYDFLRAFAIIAVLLCHMDIFYGPLNTSLQIIIKYALHDIGRIGVPIFLMISGALLLNKDYDLSVFLKKRFTRIIYPFIFWVTLLVIGLYVFNEHSMIIPVIIGDFSVTWYFWTLIGIYLAIPILNTFLKEYGETGLKYFLIIWFITMIFKTFNSYPLFSNFNLDFFAGYIGYPILGYYLNNKKFNISNKKLCILSIAVLLISLGAYVYIDYSKIDLIRLIYLNIPMVFIASSFFLFIKSIDNMTSFKHVKDNVIGKIIFSISICSYGMYFSHVMVLKVLAIVNPHSNLLSPVMFIALIFLSWLLVYIVSKIPYLKIFSGV
jgi:surface polysaccharide O-acyltransferase-like enzyme